MCLSCTRVICKRKLPVLSVKMSTNRDEFTLMHWQRSFLPTHQASLFLFCLFHVLFAQIVDIITQECLPVIFCFQPLLLFDETYFIFAMVVILRRTTSSRHSNRFVLYFIRSMSSYSVYLTQTILQSTLDCSTVQCIPRVGFC